jgi:hypothetical protein
MAWRCWGIRSIPSAWNRRPILLQILKLRVKSQIYNVKLGLLLNSEQKADGYSVCLNNAKPKVGSLIQPKY